MHGLTGDADLDDAFGGGLGGADGGVHALHLVGDIAVDHGAGAVAVVAGTSVAREDVDDDGLTGAQFAVTVEMAVGRARPPAMIDLGLTKP